MNGDIRAEVALGEGREVHLDIDRFRVTGHLTASDLISSFFLQGGRMAWCHISGSRKWASGGGGHGPCDISSGRSRKGAGWVSGKGLAALGQRASHACRHRERRMAPSYE